MNKDIYAKIASLTEDDRTILNMLSVNKKFNNPEFFQLIFNNKYPQFIKYKQDNETWKEYYLKMIYYITLLDEKFNYDYNRYARYDIFSTYNPIEIYKLITASKNIKGTGRSKSVTRANEMKIRLKALPEDKVFDISNIKPDGSNVRLIRLHSQHSMKDLELGNTKIVSNNLASIILFSKIIGDYSFIKLAEEKGLK